MECWNVGMTRLCRSMALTFQLSVIPTFVAAQKRAISFDDFLALKAVSDPQLSPDGKWVAYTVSTPSLQDNRNVPRVWVVEVATGKSRQLTGGPGSDRQPRWSPDGKTLAFISTREAGAQVWLLPIAGGDARKISSLADGVSDPVWLPDGSGLLVVSDIKWTAKTSWSRCTATQPSRTIRMSISTPWTARCSGKSRPTLARITRHGIHQTTTGPPTSPWSGRASRRIASA